MMDGKEGGSTLHYPDRKEMSIYHAAMKYRDEKVPLVVIAGAEYGSGSSRDWAAKGPMLLGVKAVIAKGFERIHRSNLIGMGILPLQFRRGEDAKSLQIDYSRPIDIEIARSLRPKQTVKMHYTRTDGKTEIAEVSVKIENPVEMEYYKSGGILHYIIKKIESR